MSRSHRIDQQYLYRGLIVRRWDESREQLTVVGPYTAVGHIRVPRWFYNSGQLELHIQRTELDWETIEKKEWP